MPLSHPVLPATLFPPSLSTSQFTVSPGPPWWAAIPRGLWPEELLVEIQRDLQLAEGNPTKEKMWEEGRGDRRTELVCIGHELDKQAASAALEARRIASLKPACPNFCHRFESPINKGHRRLPSPRLLLRRLSYRSPSAPPSCIRSLQVCLLTAEEMAAGEASWLALVDPYAKAWDEAMGGQGGRGGNGAHVHGGGGGHSYGEGHGAEAERLKDVERQLTDDLLSSKTLSLASLRKIMAIVGEQGVPTDDIFGFIFDALLDENAAKQIKECAPALQELYAASADKRRTQRSILRGVVTLVGRLVDSAEAPLKKAQEEARLKKTPSILMALYDSDLLEEQVVLKWHAQASNLPERDHEGKRVRTAAAPFIKWLQEADQESSAEEADERGALDAAAQKEKDKKAAKRTKQKAKKKAAKEEAETEAAMEAAWATQEPAPPEVQ